MRLKCFLTVLGIAVMAIPSLPALSVTEWIERSDRNMNPQIVDFMDDADFETALVIAEALGRRQDIYMEDIITALTGTHHGRESYKYEYILEVLLHSLFNPLLAEPELQNRYEANARALHQVLSALPHTESPDLKRELVRIVALAEKERYLPLLAGEMEFIIAQLQKNKGCLDKAVDQELLALLLTIQKLGPRDFVELCLRVSRLSVNRDVVKLARKTADQLASPGNNGN